MKLLASAVVVLVFAGCLDDGRQPVGPLRPSLAEYEKISATQVRVVIDLTNKGNETLTGLHGGVSAGKVSYANGERSRSEGGAVQKFTEFGDLFNETDVIEPFGSHPVTFIVKWGTPIDASSSISIWIRVSYFVDETQYAWDYFLPCFDSVGKPDKRDPYCVERFEGQYD